MTLTPNSDSVDSVSAFPQDAAAQQTAMSYDAAQIAFHKWCERSDYDSSDTELWDAFLSGVMVAEFHHGIQEAE